MNEKIESLSRTVFWGIAHNHVSLVVECKVLAAILSERAELLAACKGLLAAFDPPSKLSDSLIRAETDAVRAAIAKA